MNFNSIIIYGGVLCIILFCIVTNNWGSLIGIIIAMLLIYFLLANEEAKENIRNNLLWRTEYPEQVNLVICVRCQKNYVQVKKKHDFGIICPECEKVKK